MLEIRVIFASGNRAIFHSDLPNNTQNRERLSGYCDEYAHRLNDKVWRAIVTDLKSCSTWEL